jgi:hypothetical protein
MALSSTKLALTLASTAVSAIDTINQGRAADQASRFEAARNRQQADRGRQIATQRAADLRDNEARRRAALRTRFSGNGVTFEGSPLAVLSDLAADAELQALREINAGESKAVDAEGDAQITRFKGRAARNQAFLRAGRTLLTTAANNDFS